MNTRHLLTALTLALGFTATGAFAADVGCRTIANGVQKCDVPTGAERTPDAVAAEIHAKADTSTGCRTIANGVQKCDVPTAADRDAVTAQVRDISPYTIDGCRTIANGVQKCDVPSRYQPSTAVATAPAKAVEAH
jgi:hypothetical protein